MKDHIRHGEVVNPPEEIGSSEFDGRTEDNEQREFSVDASTAHRLTTHLQSIIGQVIGEKEFPLTDDEKHCRFCLYRGLCERGQTQNLANIEALDMDDLWLDVTQADLGDAEF